MSMKFVWQRWDQTIMLSRPLQKLPVVNANTFSGVRMSQFWKRMRKRFVAEVKNAISNKTEPVGLYEPPRFGKWEALPKKREAVCSLTLSHHPSESWLGLLLCYKPALQVCFMQARQQFWHVAACLIFMGSSQTSGSCLSFNLYRRESCLPLLHAKLHKSLQDHSRVSI